MEKVFLTPEAWGKKVNALAASNTNFNHLRAVDELNKEGFFKDIRSQDEIAAGVKPEEKYLVVNHNIADAVAEVTERVTDLEDSPAVQSAKTAHEIEEVNGILKEFRERLNALETKIKAPI